MIARAGTFPFAAAPNRVQYIRLKAVRALPPAQTTPAADSPITKQSEQPTDDNKPATDDSPPVAPRTKQSADDSRQLSPRTEQSAHRTKQPTPRNVQPTDRN